MKGFNTYCNHLEGSPRQEVSNLVSIADSYWCQVSTDRVNKKVSQFRLMTYILCQVAYLYVKFLLAREIKM